MRKLYLICVFAMFAQTLFFSKANDSYNAAAATTVASSRLKIKLRMAAYSSIRIHKAPALFCDVAADVDDSFVYLNFLRPFNNDVVVTITHNGEILFTKYFSVASGDVPAIEMPFRKSGDYELTITNPDRLNVVGDFSIEDD